MMNIERAVTRVLAVGCVAMLTMASITVIAYNRVQDEGTNLTQRQTLNFIGAGVTCVDDAGNARTNCTIPGGGGGGTGVPNYNQTFTSQTSVALAHGFNTTKVLTQCFDNATPPNFIVPQNIAITNANTVTVTFSSSQSGSCTVNGTTAATLSGSGTVSLGPIIDGACTGGTFTLTGAVVGDAIAPAFPSTLNLGLFGMMFVSAPDTVQVRVCNLSGAVVTPASSTFGGVVIR